MRSQVHHGRHGAFLQLPGRRALGTMAVGGFKTLTLIIASLYLDKIGRRPMMLASTMRKLFAVHLLTA